MKRQQLSKDILTKIKQITIRTKRLLRGSLVGDSRSALKGTGFEFDQIREYQVGDDVRFIDWKASRRFDTLLIKQYIEERTRTIFLAVDVSQSSMLGSEHTLKHDTFAQIASVLALVSASGKDKFGLILFSDEVEYVIPLGRGERHAQLIIHTVFTYQAKRKLTSINKAIHAIMKYQQKDSIIFLISDFIDHSFSQKTAALCAHKNDVYAIRCLDAVEKSIAPYGFIPFIDSETGKPVCVDIRSSSSRTKQFIQQRIQSQNKQFKQAGIRLVDISNTRDFVGPLVQLLRRRMQY